MCKGFAVGRGIFFDPARRWLGGGLDDAGLVTAVQVGLTGMLEAYLTGKEDGR